MASHGVRRGELAREFAPHYALLLARDFVPIRQERRQETCRTPYRMPAGGQEWHNLFSNSHLTSVELRPGTPIIDAAGPVDRTSVAGRNPVRILHGGSIEFSGSGTWLPDSCDLVRAPARTAAKLRNRADGLILNQMTSERA